MSNNPDASGPAPTVAGPDSHTSRRTGWRELGSTVVVAAVSAVGLLAVAGRSWYTLTGPRAAPFPSLTITVTGKDAYPALSGLAIVAVITALLCVLVAGWARQALGALLAVIGISCAVYGVRGFAAPSQARSVGFFDGKLTEQLGPVSRMTHPAWPAVTTVFAVLLVVSAAVTMVRARAWQVGLSSRYEAPAAPVATADPWRSLDRGDDPTAEDR